MLQNDMLDINFVLFHFLLRSIVASLNSYIRCYVKYSKILILESNSNDVNETNTQISVYNDKKERKESDD